VATEPRLRLIGPRRRARNADPSRSRQTSENEERHQPGEAGDEQRTGVRPQADADHQVVDEERDREEHHGADAERDAAEPRRHQPSLLVGQDDLVPRLLEAVGDRAERPEHAADDADEPDRRPGGEPAGRGEGHDSGEEKAAGLADRRQQDDDAAQVAIGAIQPGRQPALRHRPRGGQDGERGGQRRMGAEGEQQRNRDRRAGQGADEALRHGDDAKEPVLAGREDAPIRHGGAKLRCGMCAHSETVGTLVRERAYSRQTRSGGHRSRASQPCLRPF
jgi:hypothetical protein